MGIHQHFRGSCHLVCTITSHHTQPGGTSGHPGTPNQQSGHRDTPAVFISFPKPAHDRPPLVQAGHVQAAQYRGVEKHLEHAPLPFAKWRSLLHFTSPAFLTACPSPFNVSLAPKHCAGIFLDREELMYCMHTHLCLCMCADPSNIHPSGMVLPTAWKLFGGDLHECNIDW
jgi:hypothetical protein